MLSYTTCHDTIGKSRLSAYKAHFAGKKLLQFFLISLFVLQPNLYPQSPIVQQIIDSVKIDSLIYFVRELSGDVPTIINGTSQTILSRHSYKPGNALAEVYIKQKLESFGLQTTIQSFSTSGNNVIATQIGSIFPNRKFILCAHFDNMPQGPVAPGADDNASGTAAIIETARIFSQYSFPFTIIYALWDEEEQGLLGSYYYAEQAANAADSILGVINLDMIAYDTNNDNVCNIHNRDIGTSIPLYDKMIYVNTKYGVDLNIVSYNPGSTYSDHACFWYFDFGAVLLIEDGNNFNQYYHTMNDLIQYFNQPYFHKTSKLALGTLADLEVNYFYGNIFPEHGYVDKPYAHPNADTVKFMTRFSSLYNHPFTAQLIYINSGSTEIDSTMLFDDGLHSDSLANDGIYGGYISPRQTEDIYSLSASMVDIVTNEYISSPKICSFTTAGPIKLDSTRIVKGITNYYNLRPFVRNEGTGFTITNAKIQLKCDDPWVSGVAGAIAIPPIAPGVSVGASSWIAVSYYDSIFPGYFNLKADISVDGWTYWTDSIRINVITGLEEEVSLTTAFKLEQNFPNPFNPKTSIQYAVSSGQNVTLKVYDVIGNEVATVVDEYKPAGRYEVEFSASGGQESGNWNLASGIYFYQLKVGSFIETKKMILLR